MFCMILKSEEECKRGGSSRDPPVKKVDVHYIVRRYAEYRVGFEHGLDVHYFEDGRGHTFGTTFHEETC